MPIFYFDVRVGNSTMRDDEGHMLPDQQAASREALRFLPDLARDEILLRDQCEAAVHVRDETGAVIFTASLSLQAHWIAPGVSAKITRSKQEMA